MNGVCSNSVSDCEMPNPLFSQPHIVGLAANSESHPCVPIPPLAFPNLGPCSNSWFSPCSCYKPNLLSPHLCASSQYPLPTEEPMWAQEGSRGGREVSLLNPVPGVSPSNLQWFQEKGLIVLDLELSTQRLQEGQ